MLSAHSPETSLLLLCDLGVVSQVAATKLRDAGFVSVQPVAGGYEAWCLEETFEGEAAPAREDDEVCHLTPPI